MNAIQVATLVLSLSMTACGRPELVQENARLKARISSLERIESENAKLLSRISFLESQEKHIDDSSAQNAEQSNELLMCKSKLSNQNRVSELIALQDDAVKGAKFYCGSYLKVSGPTKFDRF